VNLKEFLHETNAFVESVETSRRTKPLGTNKAARRVAE
jgi:hypothetical protein